MGRSTKENSNPTITAQGYFRHFHTATLKTLILFLRASRTFTETSPLYKNYTHADNLNTQFFSLITSVSIVDGICPFPNINRAALVISYSSLINSQHHTVNSVWCRFGIPTVNLVPLAILLVDWCNFLVGVGASFSTSSLEYNHETDFFQFTSKQDTSSSSPFAIDRTFQQF
ncbi:hypothetical protein YC2023_071160 [Brassica napus]